MALVYGLHDLESLKARRIQDIGIVEINSRIAMWQAEVNRVFDATMSTFTMRDERWNVQPITRIQMPSAGYAQFVDEHGVAKPREETGYFEQGFPLMRYEDAIGLSYEALQKITVEEFSRQLAALERRDKRTALLLFWFSIFYDENWTFTSTEANLPNIPVKAGANADTDRYIVRGESEPQQTNHYLGQAAAISDSADPFWTIKEGLTQYVGTSANDRVVSFVGDTTNVAAITELSAFHNVNRAGFVQWGDDVSFTDMGADVFLGMGDTVLGQHDSGVVVVRDKNIPDNYVVNFNLDAGPPIGIREDETPSLRGLFNIDATENSGNTILRRFRRKIGFAPFNRTGFSVLEVGDATYDPPTLYENIPG